MLPRSLGIVKLIGHAGLAYTLTACKQPDGYLRGNLSQCYLGLFAQRPKKGHFTGCMVFN
jgi:hypothetical protein